MSAQAVKPFSIADPNYRWQFRPTASTDTKKIKSLWQSVRLFTFFLSVGVGFPLWNVGPKSSRWSFGQIIFTIWSVGILAIYCWWATDSVVVCYRLFFKVVHLSTISFSVNVSVVALIGFRTFFTALSNWWHRDSLARMFIIVKDLQSKLQLEMYFLVRLCALMFFITLAGMGAGGLRAVLNTGDEATMKNALNILPLISFLSLMDVVCGRSPILVFVIFAEAFIGIARVIRLRFEGLVKQSKGWITENRNAKEIDELRTLHGQLCNVIADCSSCFSSSLAVGLIVDMICITAIFYTFFMDLIPGCKHHPGSIYCVSLPVLAIYCLASVSFITVLCVEGERLYTNVSGVPDILNVVRSAENEHVEKAVSAFAAQVHSTGSAASIHRCFDIRFSLLPRVIGTVVTYLIIVIQFRQTDGTSSDH